MAQIGWSLELASEKNVRESVEIEGLRRFLLDHLEDLEDVAILAWLKRRPAREGSSLEAVVSGTRLPKATVAESVERLVARGFVAQNDTEPPAFRYAPRDPELAPPLDHVIELYSSNPLEVMGLMNAISIERVKRAALRTFADGSRVGKSKKPA